MTKPLNRAALVHLLVDPFLDRVLAFGVLFPATAAGTFRCALPASRGEEWDAFGGLVRELPARTPLLHFGAGLLRWHEERAFAREADPAIEARFLDLQKRLRAAATYPAPVALLEDFVQHGLGRDPHRHGHAGAAAMWCQESDSEARLTTKLEGDLRDMADLKAAILDAPVAADSEEREAQA